DLATGSDGEAGRRFGLADDDEQVHVPGRYRRNAPPTPGVGQRTSSDRAGTVTSASRSPAPTTVAARSPSRSDCPATTPAVTIGGIPASRTDADHAGSSSPPATAAAASRASGISPILMPRHQRAA